VAKVPSLQDDATVVAAVAREELLAGAAEPSAYTSERMRMVALRLTEQFKEALVNGRVVQVDPRLNPC